MMALALMVLALILSSAALEAVGDSCPDLTGPGQCPATLNGIIKCPSCRNETAVLVNYCMTYSEDGDGILIGRCPAGLFRDDLDHLRLLLTPENGSKLEHVMCKKYFNRTGPLCSLCLPNFSLPMYFFEHEFKCIHCRNTHVNWLMYIAIEFLPLTAFFIVIALLRIRLTSAAANGFVFFSQMFGAPIGISLAPRVLASQVKLPGIMVPVRILYSIYSIFNLNFFHHLIPPFCLWEGMSAFAILSFGYIAAVCPLAMAAIVYLCVHLHYRNCRPLVILWKPFGYLLNRLGGDRDYKGSIIGSFATFILLSYVKCTFISYELTFMWSSVYNATGSDVHGRPVMYSNASALAFTTATVYYQLMGLIVIVCIVLMLPALLMLYTLKCFQRCLNATKLHSTALRAFVDTFQGDYKDGTDGSFDCRWFAGLYFLLRFGIRVSEIARIEKSLYVCAAIYSSAALLFAYFQPYKIAVYNIVDIAFFVLLTVLYGLAIFATTESCMGEENLSWTLIVFVVLACIPLLYVAVCLLIWVGSKVKKVRYYYVRAVERYQHVNDLTVPDRIANPGDYYSELSGTT